MMNICKNRNFVTLLIAGICISATTSCSLTDSIFGGNEDAFSDKLTVYLKKDLPVVRVSSEKYAAYFDFTGAMTACNDSQTAETFNGLCQKITGESAKFDIYKLGDSKIAPLTGEVRPAQIFAQLKNAIKQQEFFAPIEEALKQITKEGRSAVLVTDFEEYTKDGQIYRHAYATPYFKSWLASGGDITFYVTDYNEGLAKHLYYVVEGLRAESYSFGASWEDIVTNAKDQTRENGADGKNGNDEPFTHLFRNLFVDLSHSDSYKLNALDVRVTDVYDDLEKYWAWHIASTNKPKIEKEEGEIYLDFEGHEAGEKYYDEKGDISPEYDYSKSPGQVDEIKDMFIFDDELFTNTYKSNPANTELGIKFKPGFTGQILQLGDGEHIFRVDFIVKSASICDLNTLNQLFGWTGNDCLYSSVKNALQDMNPIGRSIYSYFIRMQ